MSQRRGPIERLRRPQSAEELLAVRVIALAIATVFIDLLLALVFFHFERDAPRTEVTNYGDALFWVSSQISTISSSLRNPLTTEGRVLAVSIDFGAIAVVSLLFGIIAEHIHIRSPRRQRHFRDRDSGRSGSSRAH